MRILEYIVVPENKEGLKKIKDGIYWKELLIAKAETIWATKNSNDNI